MVALFDFQYIYIYIYTLISRREKKLLTIILSKLQKVYFTINCVLKHLSGNTSELRENLLKTEFLLNKVYKLVINILRLRG